MVKRPSLLPHTFNFLGRNADSSGLNKEVNHLSMEMKLLHVRDLLQSSHQCIPMVQFNLYIFCLVWLGISQVLLGIRKRASYAQKIAAWDSVLASWYIQAQPGRTWGWQHQAPNPFCSGLSSAVRCFPLVNSWAILSLLILHWNSPNAKVERAVF